MIQAFGKAPFTVRLKEKSVLRVTIARVASSIVSDWGRHSKSKLVPGVAAPEPR